MSNDVSLYTVDGSDPRLVYEPAKAWARFCAHTAGSSVTFNFNGTYVAVYGSSNSTDTGASFILDDQPAVGYTGPGDNSQDIPFYHSSTLNYSLHTLKLTVEGALPSLCLKQLQYTCTSDPIAPSASSTTSEQSLNSSATTAAFNHLSQGAICGIVLGIILVLVLVVFTTLYATGRLPRCCRRGKRPSREEGMDIVLDDMPKSPPPVGMDAFRKLLIQHAQNNAVTRLASGPNSKKSSSNGTRSTAIFSSVVVLTPPVSSSGGSHGRSDIRPQRPERQQRPSTPAPTLHVANQVQSP